MIGRLLIVIGLVLGTAACAPHDARAPVSAGPGSTAEHVERDLQQLVDASINTNALLTMLTTHDPALRGDFLSLARDANRRGGMTAARVELRQRVSGSFNRYAKRFLPVTTDESAVAFGRAAHAMMARANSYPGYNCGTADLTQAARFGAELEAPFAAMLRAFDQAIASARTSPRPEPAAELYRAEFAAIERRIVTELMISAETLHKNAQTMTPDEKMQACRVFEYLLRDILAYRSESAGPMIRTIFAALPE